jgi:site-specific DNA recombinase
LKGKPLIPYLRQSVKKEKSISIEWQRESVKRWAEANNVALAAEVVEEGVSGSKSWRTRELGAAMEAVQAGEAAGIIVALQDRLSRENGLGTAEVWDALQQVRARLVCVAENIDTKSGDHEMLFTIRAAIARDEWKRRAGHFAKGKHAAWEEGVFVGSPPSGYISPVVKTRKDGTPIHGPLERNGGAEAIRQAFIARAGGASWSEVARLLTSARVPIGASTVWSVQATRKVMMNRIYVGEWNCKCGCGKSTFRKDLVIVTEAQWKKAQRGHEVKPYGKVSDTVTYDVVEGIKRVKGRRTGGPGRQDHGSHLLSGLLTCAGCGRRLVYSRSGTTKDGRPIASYRCNGGDKCKAHANIHATYIENLVQDHALEVFMMTQPSVGHAPDTERIAELEHDRDQAVARQAAFLDAADPLDAGYKDQLAKLRAAVQAAETALLEESSSAVEHVTEEQVTAAFSEGTPEERRHFLRMVIDGAKVAKGGSVIDGVKVSDGGEVQVFSKSF